MGSVFFLTLFFFFLTFVSSQEINSAQELDLLIRDYSLKSFSNQTKTGTINAVHFPANFSGIKVDAVKFKCGSLRRYGAEVKEFHLGIGVTLQNCSERVVLIRENLGSSNLSSFYDLPNYRRISPVLGILAYNAGNDPYEVGILAGDEPITVNFGNITRVSVSVSSGVPENNPICASFDRDGKVELKPLKSPGVCVVRKIGHFGLVVLLPAPPSMEDAGDDKISRWKVAVGSSIGAALGAFLLGLLLVAMLVKVKEKARKEELVRRAYEEEALQVSMVGHFRVPTTQA